MIKRLSRCIREYTKDTVLTPVFVLVEVVMEIVVPLIMATLIDKGIDAGNMSVVTRSGLLLLVCAFCSLTGGVLAGLFAANCSAGFAKNLRKDMYYSVQGFSFSNIDRFSTAGIVTRLTTDVSNVQMAFQMLVRMTFRAPMMMIFSLIVAFRINARLSLIFLLCMPVLGLGLYLVMRNAHPMFEKVFHTYDELNNDVQENLRGIRVVKSFIREERETERFKDVSGLIYRYFCRAEKLVNLNMPLMQFCMYTCMLLISWFGARIIVSSGGTELTTGELMSLITYAVQILMSLMMLSFVVVMLTISRASAERIVEVLNEKSDLTDPPEPVTELPGGSVTFENVEFSYSGDRERLCLKNVSFSVASGMTVGILGGTGSAKSSLVQLIPRLYDVTAGRVLVGGHDVREYSLDALRGGVAMVLQKNTLFSGTVKDNMRWGDESATDEEIAEACRLARADDFIRAMPEGYDTHIEQGGANVSGGQKQRLCIARALLKKPKVLILDDSTSAVDTRTDSELREALRSSLPEVTKFIIAQRVASVMDADLILVMDGGKLIASGTHEQLLATEGIYREVWESQSTGGGDFDEQ